MHQMTKEAIRKLQTETGHALTVADFDDAEAMDKIAAKVIGQSPEDRRLLNQPFELCGVLFYPLTVAKSLWYAEKCEEWAVAEGEEEIFLFWLLTIPNTSESLELYAGYKDARKAVKRLSRRLHCTPEEMTTVYRKCVGLASDGDPDSEKSSAANYGVVISVLLREYGGTPSQWLYETTTEMLSSLFSAYAQKVDAERSGATVNGKAKAIAPAITNKMIALSLFREKVNAIRAKWEASDGE